MQNLISRLAASKPFKLGAVGILCLSLSACASFAWREAQQANTIDAYQSYLARHPGSPNAALARAGLLEARWLQLSSSEKLDALAAFQAEVDSEANETPRLRSLSDVVKARRAELTWAQVQATTNPAELEEFLTTFPTAAARPRAQARLDDLSWEAAKADGSAKALRSYLKRFGSGRHADEARKLAELPFWSEIAKGADESAVSEHLAAYPSGGTSDAARARLAELVWERAERVGTDLRAYAEYLKLAPAGPHVAAAQDNLDWAAAEDEGTIPGVEQYLKRYPEGRHAARARGALPTLRAGAPQSVTNIESAAMAKVAEQLRESLKNMSIRGATTITGTAGATAKSTNVSWTAGGMHMMSFAQGGRSSSAADFEFGCAFSADIDSSGLVGLRIRDTPRASLSVAGNRYVRVGDAWLPRIARYFLRPSSQTATAAR